MSYIGQVPLPQATEERIEKTATAGQTLFTGLTYVNGHVSVYLNGVKLDNADFTATDGTTVTLGTGAAAGDTVSFVSTTQTSALMSLPLKDSAGNNVISESGGVVTFSGTIGTSAINNLQDYVAATLPSDQSLSHATITALNLTTETDPNGWFDTTTFKFQPDVAGKYYISLTVTGQESSGFGYLEAVKIAIKKNDNSADYTGAVFTATTNEQSARGYIGSVVATGIIDMNGSSDYLYNVAYGQMYFGTGTLDLEQDSVHFSAVRIGS